MNPRTLRRLILCLPIKAIVTFWIQRKWRVRTKELPKIWVNLQNSELQLSLKKHLKTLVNLYKSFMMMKLQNAADKVACKADEHFEVFGFSRFEKFCETTVCEKITKKMAQIWANFRVLKEISKQVHRWIENMEKIPSNYHFRGEDENPNLSKMPWN